MKTMPEVLAICLVGSVARGDARPDSDIDFLVIGASQPRQLRIGLPIDLRRSAVSLICKSPEQLEQLASQGSLFFEHVRTEGQVVHDPSGIFADAFAAAATVPLDTDGEIRRRVASLKHYRDLDRFGGNYLFALAHIYGIAKGIAIARCAELGSVTFVKVDALESHAEARPDLRSDIEIIQSLRPFYDLTRGRCGALLPFAYVGAAEQTKRAVEATARLATSAG
jgi:hypothetical protein